MCLYPKLIKNRKYLPNKKNGGNPPKVTDNRTTLVPVGCGFCMECKKQKARAWQARLLEDIKTNTNAKFITLTFSDESIYKLTKKFPNAQGYTLDNAIATYAVRKWLERYRKLTKKSVRHWLITELGHNGTENVHIHGIVWTDEIDQVLDKWQYGFTRGGTIKRVHTTNFVNEKTIGYITKYVTKIDEKHKRYNAIILTSAGIGRNYVNNEKGDWKNNKYKENKTIETYKTRTGHKINMPIYWRNKIYTEEEREKLWIEKLNKNERYILGVKMKNDQEYWDSLEAARKINNDLGFGKDNDWNADQYERQQRILKQKIRIAKGRKKMPSPGGS